MDCSISYLQSEYKARRLTPSQVIKDILSRISHEDQSGVWISTVGTTKALDRAEWLDSNIDRMDSMPLFGLPFSVKDNIDVDGEPTTAACPEFEYTAVTSASVVQCALDAGAMYVGKTNLDQFATGLIGVRSPYGTPRNPFNEHYIPGGSSAGAGVSVSTGMVSFAFGTDTGGSGRVPASYNGITGYKPAPGQLSRRGLVYACRTIDTPTIFSYTADDAMKVFENVSVPDKSDPYFFTHPHDLDISSWESLRVGVPNTNQLKFFGNSETQSLYKAAKDDVSKLLHEPTEINFDVLTQINDLMFFGSLLSERDVSVGRFVDDHPDACHPVVRQLIQGSRRFTAADAYRGIYKIADAKTEMAEIWNEVDVVMVPTVGSVYTLLDIKEDPLEPNFNNGYYTNFANPLGLSAIATPYSKVSAGVPWGVTFLFKPGLEILVASLADAFSADWNAKK